MSKRSSYDSSIAFSGQRNAFSMAADCRVGHGIFVINGCELCEVYKSYQRSHER